MDSYKQHYAKRTILITGGAGSIGSNLTRTIAQLVVSFFSMSLKVEKVNSYRGRRAGGL